jgi:hypothetical protein
MSDSPTPPRTCRNGHEVGEAAQYCGRCGASIDVADLSNGTPAVQDSVETRSASASGSGGPTKRNPLWTLGVVLIVALAAVAIGGYLLGTHHHTTTTVASKASSEPTVTSSSPPSSSTTTTSTSSVSTPLDISVQPVNPSDPSAPNSSLILLPSSCSISNGVVTATGTFNGGYVPESYIRIGAVVELYVYSSPTSSASQGTQLADLPNEHPFTMGGSGPWTVTAPLDTQLGMTPAGCQVDVQPTHNFEGAGNAGG